MEELATQKEVREERAVLLDFDGTMGRSLGAWTAAYRETMTDYGINISDEELIACCFHQEQRDVMQAYSISRSEEFRERVWSKVHHHMSSVEPYPDLIETLHSLRDNGFKIGIVTNSRRSVVEPILHRWEVFHHFDTVVTIDDVSHGKPDPESVHRAINDLNVSPSNTYLVGDSIVDVHAGHKAGIRTVAFSPEENRRFTALKALHETNPSHLVHSYTDLRAVLGLDQP